MSLERFSRSFRFVLTACGMSAACSLALHSLRAEEAAPAPRTLMRLPRWIESLSDAAATTRSRAPSRRATPVLEAAPRPEPSRTTTGASAAEHLEDERHISPESAAELGMPDEQGASAGKPGRTLLRSRAAAAVDGYVTLTGGWAELATETEGQAAGAPGETVATGAPKEKEANGQPRPQLGPDASVLKRQSLPRTAAAPKPGTPPRRPTSPDVPVAKNEEPPRPVRKPQPTEPAAEPVAPPPAEAAAANIPKEPAPRDDGSLVPSSIVPDEAPTLAIDPASFRGVLPGKTTREELLGSWGDGEAFAREDGSSGISWKVDPFERVEVVIEDDTVASILIRLAEPVAVAELARQLEISDLRTVTVLNEDGVSIGEVFPERGVVFSVKPGTHAAVAVMLEPLDAESFVLRAEGELESSVAHALVDLQYAIEIDPAHVRANRLLLVVLCDQGKWRQAAEVAEVACKLDPADTWTVVKHASVLLALDRLDEARTKIDTLLSREQNPPLVAAQAERLLGRIELGGTTPDYEKAVAHFSKAIKLAAPLTTARSQAVRKAALDLQLDSHLGTALAIAAGGWQQKTRVIPKWLERSEGFAKKLREEVGAGDIVELRLCEGALAVASKASDAVDPMPWVKRTMEVRGALGEKVTDQWRRRQIDWQVGQALNLALTAAQSRGEVEEMLQNATLTAAYLERGSEMRQLTEAEQRMLGDLFFRIGILHSLQQGDHATAVTWFDKTVPLWKENPTFAASGDLGRLGESYVSMAISYWQVERRAEAVELSRIGVECMVDAVDKQQLDERALAVGYGNLSTMYAEQGDNEQSKAYAEMASRAEATGGGTVVK